VNDVGGVARLAREGGKRAAGKDKKKGEVGWEKKFGSRWRRIKQNLFLIL
jgi:hypothetical protein